MAEMDREGLIEKYGPPTTLTNGIVIQMYKDAAKLPSITSANWLISWINAPSVLPTTLRSKMQRVALKASKLRGAALEVFKADIFILPQPSLISSNPGPSSSTSFPPLPVRDRQESSPPRPIRRKVATPKKKINEKQHELLKKERQVAVIEKKLQRLKDELENQTRKMTMYSVKNVKRREERYVAKRIALRQEKNKLASLVQEKQIENDLMNTEIKELKEENAKLLKKTVLQRNRLNILRKEKKTMMKRVKRHQRSLKEKNELARRQLQTVELEKEKENERVIDMKNADGQYTDEARFCVLELTGLEVVTGKIGPVMETVGKLCGVKLSSLPSRQACQKVVDEGQVLAKTFINENVLRKCNSFGLHKDGTTRRKVKILDTSLNTDEGEAFCLGWSSVVSETGQAIADDTKEKLEEVVSESINAEDDNSMLEVLNKLEYYMNDRAANERKSCVLLDEWRDEVLRSNGELSKEVHHLHCAAHVLIGFHTYVIQAINKSGYMPSQEQKHPVARLLRDASDLFGPVGDYRGMRNQWEAFCWETGIKSHIKCYKDNRFNGLFEVAAQLFHHHQDFLQMLQSLPSKNAKQTRMQKALTDPTLLLLVECLGLLFHKITGPFWTMIISPKASHQNFKKIILQLKDHLQKCKDDPHFFFHPESFSLLKFRNTSPETSQRLSTCIAGDQMRDLMSTLSDGLLSTIQMQLKDVLESEEQTVVKAPLTNLTSERHFGHLDASQRRRPHCSLHHHSSVILLKQTRKRLRAWYDGLGAQERQKLWKRARQQGKEMRRKHQDRDKQAIMKSLKLKTRGVCEDDKEDESAQEDLKGGQMIAVACEDNWYPAVVETESAAGQDVTVSFAELGKTLGVFRWPTGKDIHSVSRRSVVDTNVQFEPRAGGRLWFVSNVQEIQKKFKKFQ